MKTFFCRCKNLSSLYLIQYTVLSITNKNTISFLIKMVSKKLSLVCMKNVVHSSLIRLEHYFHQNACYKSKVTQKRNFLWNGISAKRSWSDISIFDCNPTEEGVRIENSVQNVICKALLVFKRYELLCARIMQGKPYPYQVT